MSLESNRNLSPATSVDNSLQAKKRIRYVLPKGCIIGGSYCIEKPLGHGGMGEVYLARHMKLDIYRAIKILLPKIAVKNPMFATRFMREAKLAIQLQHPNIINVMDAEYDERLSIYYIVMEYVDGGTVRNLIRKNGPMDEREVLKIVLSVGEALAVGEERKIVHRDIKPDNIMLTKDNVVKLADLGIAKSSADSNDVDVTSPEILIGTPAYVSPEQAKDAQHVDSRADIYSLGVSMYEMLTGEKPYKGKTTVEILQQLFEAPVPEVRQKNRTVSRKVSDLVYRMMAKEKERRHRNWKAFCKEVSKLLGEDDVITGNETATTSVENIKDLLANSKGIVLGSDESKPVIDKKRLKKAAKYAIFTTLGFGLCFVLLSGVLSFSNLMELNDAIVLQLCGSEFRQQCKKYNLSPPWSMVLADSTVKSAWLDQNKPEEASSDIIVRPDEPPKPVPDEVYKGKGLLKFEPEMTPEVEAYLKENQYKMVIHSGKHVPRLPVDLPGEVSVPGGKFELSMEIPGCKPLAPVAIDLKKNETQRIRVRVKPIDATLKINCNVPDFKVMWNDVWLNTRELQVESLRDFSLWVAADGCKPCNGTYKLKPGETRSVSVILEPLPQVKFDARGLKLADDKYTEAERTGKMAAYASAKKLYRQAADNGNPIAMYMYGFMCEQGLGNFFNQPELHVALQYYKYASDKGYPDAMFKVGEFHEHGLGGIAQNAAIALEWYKRGSELNNIACLIKLGDFYLNGTGNLKCNPDIALTNYLRAAEIKLDETQLKSGRRNEKAEKSERINEARYKAAQIYEQKMRKSITQSECDEYKKLARRFYEEASRENYKDAGARLRSL